MQRRATYTITDKGRAVLRGPALWGLSVHLRDLLAMCNPQVELEHARQFLPPHSLREALYALQQLELIQGPPVEAPDAARWEFSGSLRTQPPGPQRGRAAAR